MLMRERVRGARWQKRAADAARASSARIQMMLRVAGSGAMAGDGEGVSVTVI